MVFQDPMGSLNPRWTLGQSITEPLHTERLDPSTKMQRVINALQEVGLDADFAHRYPHQVSGGQAQRAAIARAIINRPDILVLDEPVSALDIGVRSQILDLLDDLRRRYCLAMIFITHDLAEAVALSDRVVVMSARPGRIIADIPITLPRPRSVRALQKDPAYHDLYAHVWGKLEEGLGGDAAH